jgi:hypothetical protein
VSHRDWAHSARGAKGLPLWATRCTFVVIAVLLLSAPLSRAAVSVLTYHNDNARTGQNLVEGVLTPVNVHATTFGKLFAYAVDGYVYAQPLYMPTVAIPGRGLHNVVFVATEHNSMYAFDADDNTTGVLWQVSFLDPAHGVTTVPVEDVFVDDLVPEIGITGTPVIDAVTGTLYVVVKTKEVGDGRVHYVQRLHALDIATGREKFGGPQVIADTILTNDGDYVYVKGPWVAGNGEGSVGNTVPFNALWQLNRAGLLLQNGMVYAAWASHGDLGPYHGWLMGFNAGTLAPVSVFNTTPNGGLGGIWMSGGAPAADATGKIYVATGNGTFDVTDPVSPSYGDSVLKLALTPGFQVVDFFAPWDQETMAEQDQDFGSGGVLLLPDQPGTRPHLMVIATKPGAVYLLDRDRLGGYQQCGPTCDNVVQVLPAHTIGGAFSTPAYFNGRVYYQGARDVLKAFQLSAGFLSASPVLQSNTVFGFPGATPSISANGTTNAIVWAVQGDAYKTGGPAILHAYNALDLSQELYASDQAGLRDQLEGAVKWTVPTVANGKVYVATQRSLAVFGLLANR